MCVHTPMELLQVARKLLLLGIVLCACVGLYALITPGVPHEGAGAFTIVLMGLYYLVGRKL